MANIPNFSAYDERDEGVVTMRVGSFDALKKDFERTIREIREDPYSADLQEFLKEYTKLHSTLLKSHENEKRLYKKSQELIRKIIEYTEGLKEDLKVQKRNNSQLEIVETQVEELWDQVRKLHQQEQKQNENMEQITKEIEIFRKLLKHDFNIKTDSQEQIKTLEKEKFNLSRQIQYHDEQIFELTKACAHFRDMIVHAEKKLSILREREGQMLQNIDSANAKSQQQVQMKKEAEENMISTKEELTKKVMQIERLRSVKGEIDKEILGIKEEVNLNLKKINRFDEEVENLNVEVKELKRVFNEQVEQNHSLQVNNMNLKEDVNRMLNKKKEKEDQLANLENQRSRIKQEYKRVKEAREKVEAEKHRIVKLLQDNMKGFEQLKRKVDNEKNKVDELTNQKNLLEKSINISQKQIDGKKAQTVVVKGKKLNVMRRAKGFRHHSEIQRKKLYNLEREITRYGFVVQEATQKQHLAEEEIRIKKEEMEIKRKKIDEITLRIKKMGSLCETVQNDKNLYQKKQTQLCDVIAKAKKKFKFTHKSIIQIKEEIKVFERKIQGEVNDVAKAQENGEYIKSVVDQKSIYVQKLLKRIQEKVAGKEALNQIIIDAENARSEQIKEIDRVSTDKRTLVQQLMKRKSDLSSVHNMISEQQRKINLGRNEYESVCANLEMLKKKIAQLQEKKEEMHSVLDRKVYEKMKQEIITLRKRVLEEKIKESALEDELGVNLNVHRWRKLQETNMSLYNLIVAHQKLRKMTVEKNTDLINLDISIQQKEREYIQLKNSMNKIPGAEIAQQIALYQDSLKSKSKKMKLLKDRLEKEIYGVKAKKKRTVEVSNDLAELKRKYFAKKREQYKAPKNIPRI